MISSRTKVKLTVEIGSREQLSRVCFLQRRQVWGVGRGVWGVGDKKIYLICRCLDAKREWGKPPHEGAASLKIIICSLFFFSSPSGSSHVLPKCKKPTPVSHTLHPTPYSLLPTPYSLLPILHNQFPSKIKADQ